jgi:formyltetrahydrofolate hydrolase
MHSECFLSTLQNVQAHEIENLENIRYEHQMEILKHFRQGNDQKIAKERENCSEPAAKRFKSSEIAHHAEDIEKIICLQTAEFFCVRDLLQKCCIEDLHLLLLMNECEVSIGNEEKMLDVCAEVLTFGVLEKCQKCGNDEMIFAKFGYKCNGRINEMDEVWKL